MSIQKNKRNKNRFSFRFHLVFKSSDISGSFCYFLSHFNFVSLIFLFSFSLYFFSLFSLDLLFHFLICMNSKKRCFCSDSFCYFLSSPFLFSFSLSTLFLHFLSIYFFSLLRNDQVFITAAILLDVMWVINGRWVKDGI